MEGLEIMGRYPNSNYPRGAEWHKKHRYPGQCAKCGKEAEKNTMPALYIRKDGYDTHRILCRLCADFLPALLADLGVEMPE